METAPVVDMMPVIEEAPPVEMPPLVEREETVVDFTPAAPSKLPVETEPDDVDFAPEPEPEAAETSLEEALSDDTDDSFLDTLGV